MKTNEERIKGLRAIPCCTVYQDTKSSVRVVSDDGYTVKLRYHPEPSTPWRMDDAEPPTAAHISLRFLVHKAMNGNGK